MRRRAWPVVGLLLATLVVATVVVWWVWDARASKRLEERLGALREAGEPVTMDDLAALYPPVPDDRNAAVLLRRAREAFVEIGDDPPRQRVLPIFGYAELPPAGKPVPAEMLKAIDEFLAANAKALGLVHEAALRDACRFEVDFSPGHAMLLHHIPTVRWATCLLCLETVAHRERGRHERVARSLLARVRLARELQRVPVYLSCLAGMACERRAVDDLDEWLQRAAPPVSVLDRLDAPLRIERDPPLAHRLLVLDRCYTIDLYQHHFIRRETRRVAGEDSPPEGRKGMVRFVPSAYFKQDLTAYLDGMAALVAVAAKPYPTSPLDGKAAATAMANRVPQRFSLACTFLPGAGRLFASAQRHVARLESARVALAMLRYRAKKGQLPDRLDDLVPGFIVAVPLDPFDGKPLRCRKEKTGFVIYAVGRDGADDGGAIELVDGRQLDVGFRVRLPKPEF